MPWGCAEVFLTRLEERKAEVGADLSGDCQNSTELVQKDPDHQSEHPHVERTQVSKILDHFLALRSLAACSLENFLEEVLSGACIH